MKQELTQPRLARWHEWLVYLSIGLLTVSGLAWLLLERFGQVEGDFGPEPHPALPWLLMIHGILAYAFLVIAAALLPVHVRFGWLKNRNRWSGATLIAVSIMLATTALLLYYAAAEGLRVSASVGHWVTGFAMPLALAIHVTRGKASRNGAPRRIEDEMTKNEAETIKRQIAAATSVK